MSDEAWEAGRQAVAQQEHGHFPDTNKNEGPAPADEPRVFRLEDFAGDAGVELEAPPSRLEPYKDQEIADLTAFLFGFGLPLEVMDDYTRAYVARALPLLSILQAGDALAELGIHKGAGVGQAPAWLRATAAGVGLGIVGLMSRRQFMPQKGGADAGDWTGAAADDSGESGGAADD